MATWTLMRDAQPLAPFEYEGSSLDLMHNPERAFDAMDLLERHGAPIMLVPITSDVILCGGNWHGEGIFELVREGGAWLPNGEIEFFLRAMGALEHAN